MEKNKKLYELLEDNDFAKNELAGKNTLEEAFEAVKKRLPELDFAEFADLMKKLSGNIKSKLSESDLEAVAGGQDEDRFFRLREDNVFFEPELRVAPELMRFLVRVR